MQNIAVIGAGRMGGPMVDRLVATGTTIRAIQRPGCAADG
jgi:3-hydroxyisobutyrate dehydrogenase-like beta-hydroxyacid dehydrogenase